MKELEKAKNTYNNIEIPKELNEMTNKSIQQNKPKKTSSKLKIFYSSVASFLLFILVGVNVSETFALNFSKIPVIGEVVYIISRYSQKIEDNKTILIEAPEISSVDNNFTQLSEKINSEIQKIVDNYTADASNRIEEFKQEFIQGGGTEEEFNQKDISVNVSYDIKSQSQNHLSLELNAIESWLSEYTVSYYYNVDLNTGNNITLEDLLGQDYINIVNESIKQQIEQQVEDNDQASYFGYGSLTDEVDREGMFTTITSDTKFYINKSGNPVIVFDKYEIAPGYMGNVSFEIQK